MSYNNYIDEFIKLVNNNSNYIILIKYNEQIYDIVFHCNIILTSNLNFTIKLYTDFNEYCYIHIEDTLVESAKEFTIINDIINNFNMIIIFKIKIPIVIINELINTINNINNTKKIDYDIFHFNQKINEFTKFSLDYILLEQKYNAYYEQINHKYSDKFKNKLLFSPAQISKLIIKEIKSINHNKLYDHFISINYNEPFNLNIKLKYNNNTNIGNILNNLQSKNNYIEFQLILDSYSYPFIPPKFNYLKPCIKYDYLLGLLDLNIFKIENWNPTISLEYLILNISKLFENTGYNYIIDTKLNNNNIAFNEFEYEVLKLINISKNFNIMNKININIDIPKIKTFNTSKYWKSGTGYGTDNISNWNINDYIKDQDLQNENIICILINIIEYIKINNNYLNQIDDIENNYSPNKSCLLIVLLNYIKIQLNGINLLEIEKNKHLYSYIFNLLEIIHNINNNNNITNIEYNKNIIDIGKNLQHLFEELDLLITNSINSTNDVFSLYLHNISNIYYSKYKHHIQINNKINIDISKTIDDISIKDEYIDIMKKLQFDTYELPSTHRFYNYKNNKPEQTAILRILSEISSFKTSLPLNWESTIWVRIPKNNYNVFSFLISGPKDTPYENGLFEFHAYFPANYPNSVPQVLLHTTGGNTVRFNPNLYDSGKVCLSLLDTWKGHQEEKWNSKTSTFLQVMVSIQSLIFVEEPYFNEPGWEKEINTSVGKEKSTLYNEKIYPHTINLCMINMLNNPPNGFEDIIYKHFKMKKNEILSTVTKWYDNATKFKNDINTNIIQLKSCLDKL